MNCWECVERPYALLVIIDDSWLILIREAFVENPAQIVVRSCVVVIGRGRIVLKSQ